MPYEFNNTDDVFDLRDVIERFEELETELQDLHEQGQFMSEFDEWIDSSRENSDPIYAAFGSEDGFAAQHDIEEFYKIRELLKDLCSNGGDEQWRGDWYPIVLVRETHFEDHARELAEECGMITAGATWPNNCIDWGQAARELQMDYTSTEIDGITYYYR